MTEGINTVVLQGELLYPELKYTSNGHPLFKAKLRMPILDSRSGEQKHSVLRITAWDEFAEALNNLPPQSRVRVSAKIQERSYTDKNGMKKSVTDIVVDGLEATEDQSGANDFMLQGELVWPEFKLVGERGTPLFKAKVKIPEPSRKYPGEVRHSYVKITAWDNIAEGLNSLSSPFVRVSGHVQEREWVDSRNNNQKRIFTDAVVTNYVPANSEVA